MPLSKQKHNEKVSLMRILFYLFINCFTWNPIYNSFIRTKKKKKKNSYEKVDRSFGLTLKVFYQFFKTLSVANNSKTILGYSNNKKYVYCKEYYFDWLVDYFCKILQVYPTEFDP